VVCTRDQVIGLRVVLQCNLSAARRVPALTEYELPLNPVPRFRFPLVPFLSRVSPSVLIVEDEALVRALGVGLFADAGFRPIEAADSDEALEILSANAQVQLLFTDVNLPGSIDGLALARQVRDRWAHIGIIVVSGRSVPRLHEFQAGCRFHRKPYDWDLVVRHAHELTAATRPSSSTKSAASLQKWRE
jgi:two-component system, response regulator PdtaR